MVSRTIGTGGDHADINEWVAWVAANVVSGGLLTEDVVGYVLSAAEVVVSVEQDIAGWEVGGLTSGFTTTLTAAPGESFIDDASVRSNPLFYDPSKGAAIRQSGTNDPGIVVHVANCTISRLQLAKSHDFEWVVSAQNNAGCDNFIVEDCIVYHENPHGCGINIGTNATGGGVRNCLVVLAASTDGIGIQANVVDGFVLDNTVISLVENTDASGIHINFHENTVTNNVIVGFDVDVDTFAGTIIGSNNATSLDGSGLTLLGLTANQDTVVAATEFINPVNDFRVKSSTSVKLVGNGTTTGVPTTDITGAAHGGSPTIGAWQVIVAPPVITSGPTREAIMTALCAKVFAVADFMTTGRRVLMWSKVAAQPACFVRNIGDTYEHRDIVSSQVTMEVEIWIYSQAGINPDATPGAAINALVDAVETALAPDDRTFRTTTLGGLVQHVWIDGRVEYDPGDLDGQAKAVIPVKILIP